MEHEGVSLEIKTKALIHGKFSIRGNIKMENFE